LDGADVSLPKIPCQTPLAQFDSATMSSQKMRAMSLSSVGIEQVEGEIMRELERRFPPEFRNRIDDVVLCGPLAATRSAKSSSAGVLFGSRLKTESSASQPGCADS
jgi:hypothetical protein